MAHTTTRQQLWLCASTDIWRSQCCANIYASLSEYSNVCVLENCQLITVHKKTHTMMMSVRSRASELREQIKKGACDFSGGCAVRTHSLVSRAWQMQTNTALTSRTLTARFASDYYNSSTHTRLNEKLSISTTISPQPYEWLPHTTRKRDFFELMTSRTKASFKNYL